MPFCTSPSPDAAHGPGCGCIPRGGVLARRGLLGLAAAAALLPAGRLRAASGSYEAMLLNCIDPRFTTASARHMAAGGLQDRYSHFVIAGGPIGAAHPRFAAWHGAFWDNLDITTQLHAIHRVVALTHRDCGAAKLAYGEAGVATRAAESASHAETLRAFAAEVRRRKPALAVAAGIMDLDGSVEMVA